ncbi:hypothetical protein EU245_12360 [Lentibacillus lipolyticus]|nr:hypothetical protein EU245_12360 [Lentibacillus lipolyticus]
MTKYWEVTKTLANSTNQQLINEYLLSLKLANRSQLSIENYRSKLQNFFLDIKQPIEKLTVEKVRDQLQTKYAGCRETTVATTISFLASFFQFCQKEGYLSHDLIKNRWRPRLPKSIPKYLGKEEQARTKLVIEKLSLRDRAIVELLLASGCRVRELHTLNISDVDLEERTAQVLGKGNEIRTVHFHDACALVLEKYLETRIDDNPALFLSHRKRRMTVRGIQLMIQKIGEQAELKTRLTPHSLRHTFATNLLSKGADISFISEELGHSKLDTTRIYARLPQEDVVSLYRKYMG